MADYVAGRLWPDDDADHFWTVYEMQPDAGATAVTLTDGAVHRFRNAGHYGDGHQVELSYLYKIGAAGELHVVEREFTQFAPDTLGRMSNPRGRLTERVLRTYAPGSWSTTEGHYLSGLAALDPTRNLIRDTDGT